MSCSTRSSRNLSLDHPGPNEQGPDDLEPDEPGPNEQEPGESGPDELKPDEQGPNEPGPSDSEVRVPIWNYVEERLIVGQEAPTRANLKTYLAKYDFCDVYFEQDRCIRPPTINTILWSMGLNPDEHVMVWNDRKQSMLYGSPAPMRGDLPHFLKNNPDWAEFVGWEARVTQKVIRARENWLKKVRGTSYGPGPVPVPSMDDDEEDPNLNLDTTPKYLQDHVPGQRVIF